MKLLTRTIAICLIIIFCLGITASANDPPGDGDSIEELRALIEELRSQNYNLMREIVELERALADVERDPSIRMPRRPLLQVTEPLMLEIEAGTRRTLQFRLQNVTSDNASAVITTLGSTGDPGIVGVFTNTDANPSGLSGRTHRMFPYQINVSDTVKEGFYNLVFKHEYLNSYNEVLKTESIVTIRVTSPQGSVSVRDIASSLSSVPPGQDFDLTAVIRNDGSSAIRDVSMTISKGMASDGVHLRSSTNIVQIPNLPANESQNISIAFTAAQRARSGAYPLDLELTFTDARGTRQTQLYTYFVNVGGSAARENAAELIITGITRPGGYIGVGQEFEMTVTVKNTGRLAAQNIGVNAASETERAVVPRSTNRLRIDRLEPGEERQLSFRFAPTASSESQNYSIGFTVSYASGLLDSSGGDETVTFTQYQGVNVYNPEDSSDAPTRISTPRIIVSDYKSNPMIVQAGREFDLELTFKNTSGNRTVRNIRVTLSVAEEVTTGTERRGSVFTPVGRSSTFFIDGIEPLAEVQEHIRFYTLPDAPPRNYIINVNFEYEDTDNNPFDMRESIGINVKQVTKLDTSEMYLPEYADAYMPIFINFELFNTGRVTLSNLMIRVEGNFNVNQSSVFYGTLSPGSMDFYDNVITPIESGRQEGAIVISYEDDSGEHIEERKEFVIEVMSSGEIGGDGMWGDRPPFGTGDMVWDDDLQMFVPANKGSGNMLLMIGIPAGVVVIAGVTIFIILRARRKKKRRLVEIDE